MHRMTVFVVEFVRMTFVFLDALQARNKGNSITFNVSWNCYAHISVC